MSRPITVHVVFRGHYGLMGSSLEDAEKYARENIVAWLLREVANLSQDGEHEGLTLIATKTEEETT